MREVMNNWSLCVEEEDAKYTLSRFLIATDELRARLAPSKYPNMEITDEGHLWFNIDTSIGKIEIVALPFGFEEIKSPSILVSLPCKAEDISQNFLNKLNRISNNISRAKLLAGFSTRQGILDAYLGNRHPPLVCSQGFKEISKMKRCGVFFSYLGIRFAVIDKTVSEVEQIIREILLKLNGRSSTLCK